MARWWRRSGSNRIGPNASRRRSSPSPAAGATGGLAGPTADSAQLTAPVRSRRWTPSPLARHFPRPPFWPRSVTSSIRTARVAMSTDLPSGCPADGDGGPELAVAPRRKSSISSDGAADDRAAACGLPTRRRVRRPPARLLVRRGSRVRHGVPIVRRAGPGFHVVRRTGPRVGVVLRRSRFRRSRVPARSPGSCPRFRRVRRRCAPFRCRPRRSRIR